MRFTTARVVFRSKEDRRRTRFIIRKMFLSGWRYDFNVKTMKTKQRDFIRSKNVGKLTNS